MRILTIAPGASISTIDHYNGMVGALKEQGHEIYEYILDARIERAGGWLMYNWRKAKKEAEKKAAGLDASAPFVPQREKPKAAEVLYWATFPAVEMALRLQPDWVFIFSGMYFPKYTLALLRNTHLPLALLLTEDPYDYEQEREVAPLVDLVTTNERANVDLLRQYNPNTYYLPHAFDPAKHYPGSREGDEAVPAYDVVFVGTGFEERIHLFEQVDWTGINVGIYGAWELVGSRNPLRQHIKGKYVDNEYATALYRRAKVGLNLHRTSMGFGRNTPKIAHAESCNPRAYELGACGLFHLSDARQEVEDIYGELVPIFASPEQLTQSLRYYLLHDDLRAKLASSLPYAVHEHTFENRAELLLSYVQRVEETLVST